MFMIIVRLLLLLPPLLLLRRRLRRQVFAVVVAVVFDVIVFCCITFLNDTRPANIGMLAPQIPGREGSAGAPKGLQLEIKIKIRI